MHPLLSIQNLTIAFETEGKRNIAVDDVTFTVNKEEIVAIVGESGSGKSVTALSIQQLIPSPPAQYPGGKIFFSENGESPVDLLSLHRHSIQTIRGNRIGMIFQEPMTSLNPVFRCGEQVREAILAHKKMSDAEARQQVISLFEKVKLPHPAQIYDRYPHQLSGGQKQRVMIAMAMSCDPALLICDEPTTALDVTVQKTILNLIRDLQQEKKMGVIFITHDLGVVAEVADRAIVMYRGKIVEQNTVDSLFKTPQHPYTKALLACRPVLHEKGKRLPVVSDFMQPGNKSSAVVSHSSTITHEKLIQAENLTVQFPVKTSLFGKPTAYLNAVDDVSFDIFKGETLGLVGESGCGKTTLGRTLLRLIEPTSGKIFYNGKDLTKMPKDELRQLRPHIQIVFQDPYSSLNPRMTIGEAISEALKVHHVETDNKKRRERVMMLLEKVDLKPEHYKRYPHEFSGGQRQRIVIARALAMNPSFIVCDESVSALDVSVQAQVLNLLNDLKSEFAFTNLFISHDLSVVKYISDRIMVMKAGKIVETGKAEEIYNHPKSDYTRGLIASIPAVNVQ